AEDGIRDRNVTGVQTCALPILFPDGSVQLSAAAGGASGTPNNTPNSLVQRDASGGFAAGSVLLNQLIVGGASVGAQVNPDGGFRSEERRVGKEGGGGGEGGA